MNSDNCVITTNSRTHEHACDLVSLFQYHTCKYDESCATAHVYDGDNLMSSTCGVPAHDPGNFLDFEQCMKSIDKTDAIGLVPENNLVWSNDKWHWSSVEKSTSVLHLFVCTHTAIRCHCWLVTMWTCSSDHHALVSRINCPPEGLLCQMTNLSSKLRLTDGDLDWRITVHLQIVQQLLQLLKHSSLTHCIPLKKSHQHICLNREFMSEKWIRSHWSFLAIKMLIPEQDATVAKIARLPSVCLGYTDLVKVSDF